MILILNDMAGKPGINKGNHNGGGRKGRSGRKSLYQERADADFLQSLFFTDQDKEEIKKKLKSGKYSIKDVWVDKLVNGNEKLLSDVVRKLFPDKSEITGKGGNPIQVEDTTDYSQIPLDKRLKALAILESKDEIKPTKEIKKRNRPTKTKKKHI